MSNNQSQGLTLPWLIGANNLGLWLPTMYPSVIVGTWGVAAGNVNKTFGMPIMLPYRLNIAQFIVDVTTLSAGNNVGVGLYDSSGNKVVISGAISTTTTGVKTSAVTSVQVNPGYYFYCWNSTSATPRLNGVIGQTSQTFVWQMMANMTQKYFTAANNSAAGVLPNTLGALTTFNPNTGNANTSAIPFTLVTP